MVLLVLTNLQDPVHNVICHTCVNTNSGILPLYMNNWATEVNNHHLTISSQKSVHEHISNTEADLPENIQDKMKENKCDITNYHHLLPLHSHC